MSAQDRLHNQQTPSPEAVGDMLRELQTSLEALATRVDALAVDLKAIESGAGRDNRRLGLEVANLGQALVERIRKVETFLGATTSRGGPPATTSAAEPNVLPVARRRGGGLWAWVLGVLLAGAAAAGVWVYQFTRSAVPHPVMQRGASLAALPKATVTPAPTQTAAPDPLPVKAHKPLHHWRHIATQATKVTPNGLHSDVTATAPNPP